MQGSFRARLKDIMRQKKLTLREVGAAVGVSGQAVHFWTQKANPSISVACADKLAAYLGVSPGWLIFGEAADSNAERLRMRVLYLEDQLGRIGNVIMEAA